VELKPSGSKKGVESGRAARKKTPLEQTIVAELEALPEPEPLDALEGTEAGDRCIETGNVESAIEHYRHAVRMESGDPDRRTRLGDAYAYADLSVKAAKQYRKAIKTSPRRAAPHFSLLAEEGAAQQALMEMETARDLEPDNSFYHFRLGDLYARLGRRGDALVEMQQAAIFSPLDDYYNARLGMLYLEAGCAHEAVQALEQALHLAPTNPSYHCLMGNAYARLGEEQQSMLHYRLAGRLDLYDAAFVERMRGLNAGTG
jgi:Flp pilus assembly protein TadD